MGFVVKPAKRRLALILAAALIAPGCVGVPRRNPLPRQLATSAAIPGIPQARFWGDESPDYLDEWFRIPKERVRQEFPKVFGRPHAYLALSGGGADGAFGAGFLNGWTETGNRPEFTFVTGISTGALMAPFAFVGPDYDHVLKQFYTTSSTNDIAKRRNVLAGLRGDALASTKPLQRMLERTVGETVRQQIAAEHRKGRRLFIGTTNLDAGRPVIWNVGAIAASSHPRALALIRKLMLASAAVPAAFPPVLVDVEAAGRGFDEIHVDGGVSTQLFLYPANVNWKRVQERLAVPGPPRVYLIRNSRLEPRWETVKNKLLPIAGRSVSELIRAQGIGDLYRIYLQTRRDELDFHLAFIPADFDEEPSEPFDPSYMTKLFDVGYRLARADEPWAKAPPGFVEP
ncbi:MAG: patatin [bacterium]|nr:patatin [bacterium]